MPCNPGDCEMGMEPGHDFPKYTEFGVLGMAHSGLAANTASAMSILQQRFVAFNSDAAMVGHTNMWTPSMNASMAYRTAQESGAGRTRVEANTPAGTQTVGGGGGGGG